MQPSLRSPPAGGPPVRRSLRPGSSGMAYTLKNVRARRTMNRDRWRQVEQLYHLPLELEPGDRDGFLAQVCRDEDIRREVGMLLTETDSRSLLDVPAWQAGARLLADVE